jgi:hypothetical protein
MLLLDNIYILLNHINILYCKSLYLNFEFNILKQMLSSINNLINHIDKWDIIDIILEPDWSLECSTWIIIYVIIRRLMDHKIEKLKKQRKEEGKDPDNWDTKKKQFDQSDIYHFEKSLKKPLFKNHLNKYRIYMNYIYAVNIFNRFED